MPPLRLVSLALAGAALALALALIRRELHPSSASVRAAVASLVELESPSPSTVTPTTVEWRDGPREREDLRQQLRRWLSRNADGGGGGGGECPSPPWDRGMPLACVRGVVEHWLHHHEPKWDERRRALVGMGRHEAVVVDGLRVHYVDAGEERSPTIMVVHGWPGSFTEFVELVPLLVERGFRVIVPSLPGFGMSAAPDTPFSFVDAAVVLAKLMRHLAVERYVCQGGDWGSLVCSALGQIESPARIKGVHLNMAVALAGPLHTGHLLAWPLAMLLPTGAVLSKEDHARLTRDDPRGSVLDFFLYIARETGYFHEQATKPDTIGAVLDDSPVALAVWIVEKFVAWSADQHAPLNASFAMDRVLDNVAVHWFSRCSTTAARWYHGSVTSKLARTSVLADVPVPVGVFDARGEIFRPPKAWLATKYPHLATYAEAQRGGHFAAMANPAGLASDVARFCGVVGLA